MTSQQIRYSVLQPPQMQGENQDADNAAKSNTGHGSPFVDFGASGIAISEFRETPVAPQCGSDNTQIAESTCESGRQRCEIGGGISSGFSGEGCDSETDTEGDTEEISVVVTLHTGEELGFMLEEKDATQLRWTLVQNVAAVPHFLAFGQIYIATATVARVDFA